MTSYEITIREDGTCVLKDMGKQPPADSHHCKDLDEAKAMMMKFIAMKKATKTLQFDENGLEVK